MVWIYNTIKKRYDRQKEEGEVDMKLTLEGLKDRQSWEKAGITLPSYDAAAVAEATRRDPVWVHMGIGNIFRIFIGGIADQLLEEGLMDRGITCVETFDYDVVDKIYDPFDNLALSVTLHGDGTTDRKVLGSLTEAIKAQSSDEGQWERMKEIFQNPGLQLVSFTITEKGYALRNAEGAYFSFVESDIENGPDKAVSAMAVVTAMLLERYKSGKAPLAHCFHGITVPRMDPASRLCLEMAEEWKKRGFVRGRFYCICQ